MMPCSRLSATWPKTEISRPAHRRGRAGTTLVEVLVVFGIISIFTTALFALFLGSLKTYDTGSSKGVSDTNVSLALQKAARAIDDGMTASVSSGQLTVQYPWVNAQGDYDRSLLGDTVKLYVSDITTATFSVSGGSVTVTLTGQGRLGKDTQTTQMSQVVALRNYDAS
jgi:type II secretory pathway pseudopilin PulG